MIGRALVALVLVIGFYVVTLGGALALLAGPSLWLIHTGKAPSGGFALVFLCCGATAIILTGSALGVRRAAEEPEGTRLARKDAPELFAILDELAQRAETAPPSEVFLVPRPELCVSQRDGKRTLVIGAPLLLWSTVDELRAGLAHELGHFAFGDTRLLAVRVWGYHAFRHALRTTSLAPTPRLIMGLGVALALAQGISHAIVSGYARFFFSVTFAADRRAELAADQLAAKLVGPAPAIRMLDKSLVLGACFDAYLGEVARVAHYGVFPADLLGGFHAFRQAFEARGILAEMARLEETRRADPFDPHPSPSERKRALQHAWAPERDRDERDARILVKLDLAQWLAEELRPSAAVQVAPWADIPRLVHEPGCWAQARSAQEALRATYPTAATIGATFAAVVRDVAAGKALPARDPRPLMGALFRGALLESGARIEPSLGQPALVFEHREARLVPMELTMRAFVDDDARIVVEQWASKLGQPLGAEAASNLASFSSTIMSAMR